ncbi:MAG: IS66 family transposase zinc-finger binding domain-containing protein [Myxococcota bacterium]
MKLQELVNERTHALFGDSSERRTSASTNSTGSSEDDDAISSPGHGPTEQPDLPVITEVCELDEADKICPKCGGELTEIKGQSEDSEEIDLIERRLVVRKRKRLKYRCTCNACVETAPGPEKLIPGGRYDVQSNRPSRPDGYEAARRDCFRSSFGMSGLDSADRAQNTTAKIRSDPDQLFDRLAPRAFGERDVRRCDAGGHQGVTEIDHGVFSIG